MKETKTNERRYSIVAETNGYLANRLAEFNGKCKVIKESGLTLVDAKKELLRMYNDMYDGERPYACNWGMAVIQSRGKVDAANPTLSNGTRSFSYDGRRYSIEEELITA